MNKSEREKAATTYLKANLEKLFQTYLNGHNPLDEKLAFFTAGPSGAGKTEFVQEILNIKVILFTWILMKLEVFSQTQDTMDQIAIYFKNLPAMVCNIFLKKQ